MKAAVIAPISLLDTYIGDYNLILCDLVHKYPAYRDAYAKASAEGKFVILDNSAHENGIGECIESLEIAADLVHPNEIVLPDRLFFADDTVRMSTEACGRLKDLRIFGISLMAVPQGRTPHEWAECCKALLDLDIDTIGISKDFETWEGGLVRLVRNVRGLISAFHPGREISIHMLGWGRDLQQLVGIREIAEHPLGTIRGVDSAKPLVYAHAGLRIPEDLDPKTTPKYPGRSKDYFELPADKFDGLAEHNVNVFRSVVEGVGVLA